MTHDPMEDRQKELLVNIIESYIREADPVGSRALEGALGLSSATIRSEMVELETQGYLYQPYTSAGRVPTALGYQFYVREVAKPTEPATQEQKSLQTIVKEFKNNYEQLMKQLAKELAEASGEAVMVVFNPHDVYYTGLAQLFQQPEFTELDMVQAIGAVVDTMEEATAGLYKNASDEVQVKVGNENPLNEHCALVLTRYNIPVAQNPSLVSFLGPLRMNYRANMGRLEFLRRIL